VCHCLVVCVCVSSCGVILSWLDPSVGCLILNTVHTCMFSHLVLSIIGIQKAPDPLQRWHHLHALHRMLSAPDAPQSCSNLALEAGADHVLVHTIHEMAHHPEAPTLPLLLDCSFLLWSQASARLRRRSLMQQTQSVTDIVTLWRTFRYDNHILQSIFHLLRLWARQRDPVIRKTVLHSGILDRIQKSSREISLDNPLRPTALALLKDLSFRAEPEQQTILYNAMKDVVLQHTQDPTPSVVEHMLATLWNWASVTSIGQSMASWEPVWKLYERLWADPSHVPTMICHRNASAALGSMIAACTNSSEGPPAQLISQTWLVPHLLSVLQNEHDFDWRRRCIRTVRCLSSCEWGRQLIWNHTSSQKDLFQLLIEMMKNSEDELDTRVQACYTINSLLPSSNDTWEEIGPFIQGNILELIEDGRMECKLMVAACQTLRIILECSPEKPLSSCFSVKLYGAIHSTVEDSEGDAQCHLATAELLLQLTLLCIAEDDVTNLIYGRAISTVVLHLSAMGPDFEDSRRLAVEIVAAFVKAGTHNKYLAAQETLLTALVNLCLMTRGELKDQTKNIIVSLIPEL
jgi:hypothetical protein